MYVCVHACVFSMGIGSPVSADVEVLLVLGGWEGGAVILSFKEGGGRGW